MKGYQKSKAKEGLDPKTANKTNYELGTYNNKYIVFPHEFLEEQGSHNYVSRLYPNYLFVTS
jgi:hypothetical protein